MEVPSPNLQDLKWIWSKDGEGLLGKPPGPRRVAWWFQLSFTLDCLKIKVGDMAGGARGVKEVESMRWIFQNGDGEHDNVDKWFHGDDFYQEGQGTLGKPQEGGLVGPTLITRWVF